MIFGVLGVQPLDRNGSAKPYLSNQTPQVHSGHAPGGNLVEQRVTPDDAWGRNGIEIKVGHWSGGQQTVGPGQANSDGAHSVIVFCSRRRAKKPKRCRLAPKGSHFSPTPRYTGLLLQLHPRGPTKKKARDQVRSTTPTPIVVQADCELDREFFARDVLEVAPDCLGLHLVAHTSSGCASGRIVEVEAYRGPDDRAAHSFGGRSTPRTEAMFGPPGYAYVFLIYGIHSHINIVTGAEGEPQAVLIRALEPLTGVELMQQRRGGSGPLSEHDLCNGPGKLCKALGIDRRFNRTDLLQPRVDGRRERLLLTHGRPGSHIEVSTRIGVDYAGDWANKPWRFYDPHSRSVSRFRKRNVRGPHV